MNEKEKKELLKEIEELEKGAEELIDFGNSTEKARGDGMKEVIKLVKKYLKKK
jgi:hypothetical protein